MRISSDRMDFLYSGDIQSLLAVLANGEIRDVSVSNPGLEEIFLHYYEGGEEQ